MYRVYYEHTIRDRAGDEVNENRAHLKKSKRPGLVPSLWASNF